MSISIDCVIADKFRWPSCILLAGFSPSERFAFLQLLFADARFCNWSWIGKGIRRLV